MPETDARALAVWIAVACAFLFGLWRLFDLRFSAGDVYPQYSSLRADPVGAKAFYESVARLPEASVTRNYRAPGPPGKAGATALYLGQNPVAFEALPEKDLIAFEDAARAGARVVIAMLPVRRRAQPGKAPAQTRNAGSDAAGAELPALYKRWGLEFEYTARTPDAPEVAPGVAPERPDAAKTPKFTALRFRSREGSASRTELRFGPGAVVLIASAYPFSNEALVNERDPALLAWALGGNHAVEFDEAHLGLTEDGSIAALGRKYRLTGFLAALLALAALFVWKSSSNLLPSLPEPQDGDLAVAARDARSGLSNLLRRNIPAHALMRECVRQWERAQPGNAGHSPGRAAQIRRLASESDPVAGYRQAARAATERN